PIGQAFVREAPAQRALADVQTAGRFLDAGEFSPRAEHHAPDLPGDASGGIHVAQQLLALPAIHFGDLDAGRGKRLVDAIIGADEAVDAVSERDVDTEIPAIDLLRHGR